MKGVQVSETLVAEELGDPICCHTDRTAKNSPHRRIRHAIPNGGSPIDDRRHDPGAGVAEGAPRAFGVSGRYALSQGEKDQLGGGQAYRSDLHVIAQR